MNSKGVYMKKLWIVLATVLLVACFGALGYTGWQMINTLNDYQENLKNIEEIDAIPPSVVSVDTKWEKEIPGEEINASDKSLEDKHSHATYQYKNIKFVSYSEAWDEAKLEALCEELLKNNHGREIDYLEQVKIYGHKDEDAAGYQEENTKVIEVPLRHHGTLKDNFVVDMYTQTSRIVLYNGDERTTVQSMARILTHEYGHHFTFFYFGLEEDEIKESEYYKLRFVEDMGIRINRDNYDEYLENHHWYLIEIAANDYEYLMGSPTIRNYERFYDAKERLSLSIKGKNDEAREIYKSCFNLDPHENVALPLPDQVEGLPELFFEAIDMDVPSYEDRTEEAAEIDISISKRSEYGHRYYRISWDKPWSDKDVTYTLAAYDENDDLLGGVKSIKGNEKARALIGETVVVTSDGSSYYYWPKGYWTEMDFVRFRVVVTFPDGTAVVSPPVDKRF